MDKLNYVRNELHIFNDGDCNMHTIRNITKYTYNYLLIFFLIVLYFHPNFD